MRNLGIALIFTTFSLLAWKFLVGAAAVPAGRASGVPAKALAGAAELTIPIEIVESGGEPRLYRVRVSR